MIQGRIVSEMIRIWARKSELQGESRSYGPEVRVTAGQTPRIRAESPKKRGPEWGLGASTDRAFLNPANENPHLPRPSKRLHKYSFHVDLRNGLRELTAFAEH